MKTKIFSNKIPKNNNLDTNKVRLIKKNELDMIKNKNIKNFKNTKSNTPKYNKNKNFKIIQKMKTPPKSNKIESHNKLLNVSRKFSSLNNSINNPIRNNNTYNLQFYIQNNNSQTSYRDNTNNNMGNVYIKNSKTNKVNSNSMNNSKNKGDNNYIEVNPLKVELKTDNQDISSNINNNNLKILIDIMNSDKYNSANSSLNINENENTISRGNYINKINSKRILYRPVKKLVKYSKTEIPNSNNTTTNNIQSYNNEVPEMRIDNMKSIKLTTIKDLFNKISNNKFERYPKKKEQTSNNIAFIDSNLYNEKNLLTAKVIKRNQMRYLSEKQKSLKQYDRLKTSQENYTKVINNIFQSQTNKSLNDGSYSLKQKIKNDLDQFKKNKELSQQLEVTTKELDKMQNMRTKFLTAVNDNIEMQKKYNFLIRRNGNISQEIDDLHKKVEEKDYIIKNLSKEIVIKDRYIKSKEKEFNDLISQKDEKIKQLNTIVDNLKQKLSQIENENNILYKFKDLYNENASKTIELEKNMNEFKEINEEYIQLKKNNEELENKCNELFDIQNKYNILFKENSYLKESEKNYKELLYKYSDLEENYNKIKDIKNRYEMLSTENKKLNEIKKKYEKMSLEMIDLKEIREKYGKILKEQKNLIIIENKYNDLLQESQELRSVKDKFDEYAAEKERENNENIAKINKLKIELNGVIKEKIIIKDELEMKLKEMDELKDKLYEYKSKYDNKNSNSDF